LLNPTCVFCAIIFTLFSFDAFAQTDSSARSTVIENKPDTIISSAITDTAHQTDVKDILRSIFKRKAVNNIKDKKSSLSVLPGINYSPSSGLGISASANLNYFASEDPKQKLSMAYALLSYNLKKQTDFTLYSILWTKKNNYGFQGTLWLLQNDEYTYGLGSLTKDNKKDLLSYSFTRFYESVLKKIYGNIFAGIGYKLDYHHSIIESGNKDGSISDFSKYGSRKRTISSGLSYDFLFDTRINPINPLTGTYINIVYSPKSKWLGSDDSWQLYQIDGRKYFTFPAHSKNVLAFWSLLSFTNGNAPYLDLPATGWDYQQKSSRGYIQGRYRGKNMLYFESEYRFSLTNNGLLGAVVFANTESFSGLVNNGFQKFLPAAGGGIRIKLDKRSALNASIDYGVGINGSKGLFFNIGEVF